MSWQMNPPTKGLGGYSWPGSTAHILPLTAVKGGREGSSQSRIIESSMCEHQLFYISREGMKYWDSGLNAPGSRRFIGNLPIAAAVIGWKRSGKERRGQTQFSTKFAAKLSFMPPCSSVYSFLLFLKISSPMWPNRGFRCRLRLTLWITLLNFFSSHKNLGKFWQGLFFPTSVNFTNLCKVLEKWTFFNTEKFEKQINKLAANWFFFLQFCDVV